MGKKYYPQANSIQVGKKSFRLKDIIISPDAHALDEVSVTARRPYVSYKGNKVIYNLSANPAAVGGNVFDGLKLLPGVTETERDKLSLYGFYSLTIAINGVIRRLSAEEISALLSTMSVDDISSVEIIRNPGPEYGQRVDALLNIVTRKKAEDGVNAFISSDLSHHHYLSESLRGRLNMNKSITKNYVSYNFSQKRYYETLDTNMGSDTTETLPRTLHQIRLGTDLNFSPRHILGLHGSLSLTDERFAYNTHNKINLDRKALNTSLYHNLSGDSWRWTTDAGLTFSRSSREHLRQARRDHLQDEEYRFLHAQSGYVYRFVPEWSWRIGMRYDLTDYKTEHTVSKAGGISDYRESTLSAYTTLYYTRNKFNAYAGVKFNHDRRGGKVSEGLSAKHRTFNSWQPYLMISYDPTPKHHFGFDFDVYYYRPSICDLLPYVSSSSSFLKRRGNPDLLNSLRKEFRLNYTFMRAGIAEFYYSDGRNSIVEYITPDNGAYVQTKANLDYNRFIRLMLGAPVPLINKEDGTRWIVATYFAYEGRWKKGMLGKRPHKEHINTYYVHHKHMLYLPKDWYFDAQVVYFSPMFYESYQVRSMWWVDLSMNKRVGDWKFSLSCFDLFNTGVAKGEYRHMDTPLTFVKDRYGPTVTLGISLSLGRTSLKTYKERNITTGENRLNQSADEGFRIEKQ